MLISNAYAQAAGGAAAGDPLGGLMGLPFMLLMFVVMWFVMIRPQMKRQKETKAMLDDFENARVMYTERNFLGCKEALRVILDRFPEDGPSAIYKNRCEFFLRKPPNIDWSPIVSFDEK